VNFVFIIIITTLNSVPERSLTWIIASLASCFARFFPRDKQSPQPPALSCQSASRSVSSPQCAILSWPSSGKRYRLPHPLPLPLCRRITFIGQNRDQLKSLKSFIRCFIRPFISPSFVRAFARFWLFPTALLTAGRARQHTPPSSSQDPWRRRGYTRARELDRGSRSAAAGESSEYLVVAIPSRVRVFSWFVRSFVGVGVQSIEKHRHACASDRARPRSLASTRWEREHCVLFAALFSLSLCISPFPPLRYRLPVLSSSSWFSSLFLFRLALQTERPMGAPRKRILRVEKFPRNRHVLWTTWLAVPLEALR